MGLILFDKMGFPIQHKSRKTGVPSVDNDTLETLQGMEKQYKTNICTLVMQYREVSKLKSTYTEGLRKRIDKEHRVHTTFRIGGTITGRLSSKEPNLQNIPVRTELGREIRKCFIARAGYKLIVADYHNIELRLLAHFSEDKNMTEAYKKGESLHERTAIEILQANPQNITKDVKARAKGVNFGLMYGMWANTLAETLGVSREKGREIYDRYFEVYCGIKPWQEKVIEYCRTHGYVLTLLGRRRHIPKINYVSEFTSPEQFHRKYGHMSNEKPLGFGGKDPLKDAR
jgi:DNA polymerase-1